MESDDEIEYLDEDADIVQQYVQPPVKSINKEDEKLPLLVEREPLEKRKKRRKEYDDSDYDPDEDMPRSPESGLTKKRKPAMRWNRKKRIRMSSPIKVKVKPPIRTVRNQSTPNVQNQTISNVHNKRQTTPNIQNKRKNTQNLQNKRLSAQNALNKIQSTFKPLQNKSQSANNSLNKSQKSNYSQNKSKIINDAYNKSQSINKAATKTGGTKNALNKHQNTQNLITQEVSKRMKMDIRIPDYPDPLCMPVRALRSISSDLQRLKTWNNACLEHFKQSEMTFKPENGQTKSSARTIILRNVVHKETGRTETAVWTKTCVENREGVKKSEIFQGILPKYREKKVLNPYNMLAGKKSKVHHCDDVLLTKDDKSDTLVVYKPKDCLSTIYKLMKKEDRDIVDDDDDSMRLMKEVACCKVCVPCYQMSWRGTSNQRSQKQIQCPICKRTMVSVYNLLTHLKGHKPKEISKNKRAISSVLAKVLQYHYKCRVCQEMFPSIKELRRHIMSHKGTIPFRCAIGNHITT